MKVEKSVGMHSHAFERPRKCQIVSDPKSRNASHIWLTLKRTQICHTEATQIWEKNVLHNSYNVFYRWLKFLKIWISKSVLCIFFYFLYLISFSVFYISYIFLFFLFFTVHISSNNKALFCVGGLYAIKTHNFFLEIVKYK